MFWAVSKSYFPSPAEIKTYKIREALLRRPPSGFSALSLKPFISSGLFFHPVLAPGSGCRLLFPRLLVSCDSFSLPIFLAWGAVVSPVTWFSEGPKRSC